MKIADQNDIQVAADFAHHHGQIVYAASSAERVLIYTPTFIVAGLVARVGYTAIEVIQASIVFETGKFENAIKGDFKDHQSWPTPIRVPHSAICLCTHIPVDEDAKAEDIRSVESWIESQENRVLKIGSNSYSMSGSRSQLYSIEEQCWPQSASGADSQAESRSDLSINSRSGYRSELKGYSRST